MQAQLTGSQRKLAPLTSRTFGRFRLERRLAYGGMAEILLAVDLRTRREVALKRILPQHSANPEFEQFFIHEGRLGQRLIHPNLVQTHEAGKVGETCYIALEYLRGATCIEVLRAAAKAGLELPLGAAVRIVADAARGLHYAHMATDATGRPLGVVHRDVTPHNLFLCRDGRTKVLDFGIAKAASQLHVTRTGTIKGKFSYLAPEQIRGEAIDHRVDVFALGIVLHELLTLKPLFRGLNDAETLQRILSLEVPPPERVRHAVPPGLGAVALRALQRDRERRLPSAEALADSIEAVAEAECIDASHDVVAGLLAELCPPPIEELAPAEEPELEFGPEPPSAPGAIRSSDVVGAPAIALGATGSVSEKQSGPLPLPLPPPPETGPRLMVLGELDLDALPETELPTPVQDLEPIALADTPVERPAPPESKADTPVEMVSPDMVILDGEAEVEVAPAPPVAVGQRSGSAPALEPLKNPRIALMAAVVVAAALVLLAVLLLRHPRPEAPPPAPPPPRAEAPQIAAPPPAPLPALPVEKAAPMAEEGLLRVTAENAGFTVDGKAARPAADGALHLPPGRHKVVVSGPQLATPRSFDVTLAAGETVTRAVHAGRGRLRLAVTPWAEVQLDGRAAGTTPLQPIDLAEGAHWLALKNGELGANVKRRVVVFPDKETALKVDLFSEKR
jgi:eukaryotic-like serine/threonine-protein kinase